MPSRTGRRVLLGIAGVLAAAALVAVAAPANASGDTALDRVAASADKAVNQITKARQGVRQVIAAHDLDDAAAADLLALVDEPLANAKKNAQRTARRIEEADGWSAVLAEASNEMVDELYDEIVAWGAVADECRRVKGFLEDFTASADRAPSWVGNPHTPYAVGWHSADRWATDNDIGPVSNWTQRLVASDIDCDPFS